MIPLWHDAAGGATKLEVVRLDQAAEIAQLIHLFEAIAQEQSWQPGTALGQWVPHSVYFALHSPSTKSVDPCLGAAALVGGLQLVLPDANGQLPSAALWPEVVYAARSAHIAMLALEAAWRGTSGLFWSLAVEMWRYCVGAGITSLSLEVTPRVLPLYLRLGWPLRTIGELRLHWGEPCYLCRLGIPEVAQALLHKAEHSAYYRQIVGQAFRVPLVEAMIQKPVQAHRCAMVA